MLTGFVREYDSNVHAVIECMNFSYHIVAAGEVSIDTQLM